MATAYIIKEDIVKRRVLLLLDWVFKWALRENNLNGVGMLIVPATF